MDSAALFSRFEDALLEADRVRARRAAERPRARQFALRRIPIGPDIPLIAAATLSRRQDEAAAPGYVEDHLTAQLRAARAVQSGLESGPGTIALGAYLRQVCEELPSPDYQSPNVRIDIDAETIDLDADRAIRLGLITAELVMNAFQHAFAVEDFDSSRRGAIRITARGHGSVIASLSVSDTGRGFPTGFVRGFGLLGVEALADAIGGTVIYSEGPAAGVLITFSGGYVPPPEFYGLSLPGEQGPGE